MLAGAVRDAAMLIAIFADIHSNRQAFSACLIDAYEQGAGRIVLLGDYVGYGADPVWTVNAVMDLVDSGAVAVLGNHDSAINNPRVRMNMVAQAAIDWTRDQLSASQRRFLAELPLTHTDGDRLYVHAEASDPQRWTYVTNIADAAHSITATSAHVTFCGHIHQPAVYSMVATAQMTGETPRTGIPIRLLSDQRWLAVVGSVGQPRDGDPAACYVMLDTERNAITYCRVPYDVEAAAAAIRKKGLPDWLAERLLFGQ
jgi:diadenosine tetraphosphatase ApaH/serine/threonine PP2A family protein phosphatase